MVPGRGGARAAAREAAEEAGERLARQGARQATRQAGGSLPEKAYHYTRKEVAALIEEGGLRSSSGIVYATPHGGLSPLQAQIDLPFHLIVGCRQLCLRWILLGCEGQDTR